MIDTHAHLFEKRFKEDRDEVVQRARKAGIKKILLPNIDAGTMDATDGLAEDYPDICFAAMGLHPTHVREDYKDQLDAIKARLFSGKYYAVGEIGIDLYWDTHFKDEQIDAFLTQVRWAKELNLPIIIHARNSLDLLIDLVRSEQDGVLRGVFHCFTGDTPQARAIMDLGFMLGIGGIVTFRSADLSRVVAEIGADRLVLETDAPYLAPAPFRGKRNESAFLPYIRDKVAELVHMPAEEVETITDNNAEMLFWPQKA